MHVYRIDDGEYHWYAANSGKEAIEFHLKQFFELDFPKDRSDNLVFEKAVEDAVGLPLQEIDIEQLDSQKELTVRMDDGTTVAKTCEEWVKDGPGLVCSTCY